MNLLAKRTFIVPSLLVFLALNGCASSKDTLSLDNVIHEEELRKERQAAQEVIDKKAAEIEAKEEIQRRRSSANLDKTPQEIIAKAKARPEELEFLEIPDNMTRLNSFELTDPAMQEKIQKTFPDLAAGWHFDDSSVMLLSGVILMQKEQVLYMTRDQFLESVAKVKVKYETYYKKQFNAPMTFEVVQEGPLIFVKMTSKYLDGGEWWSDERLIYFYKPDYRLNILVTGKESDLIKVKTQTDGIITLFERRLSQYFKEGIKFREA